MSFLANIKIGDIKNTYEWFKETKVLNLGTFNSEENLSEFLPKELLEGNLKTKDNFNSFLSDINIGIKDIKIEETNSEDKAKYNICTIHLNNDNQNIEYLPISEESDGTLKMISLYSDIKKCLSNGETIFVDELDAKLHPLLTKYLIQKFHNKNSNPNNAQLIYITHDVINLKKENFRRDEIWFVEKNIKNESTLYFLVEYKIDKKLEKMQVMIKTTYLGSMELYHY